MHKTFYFYSTLIFFRTVFQIEKNEIRKRNEPTRKNVNYSKIKWFFCYHCKEEK